MIIAINILLILISLAILAPLAGFVLECFLAILPRRRQSITTSIHHPRTAIIIPAHNEQSVLQQTLHVLLPTLDANDRVLVVADNCHDQTSQIAQSLCVEVINRNDPARQGKGYALDFALQYLHKNPPEVIVILDADCLVSVDTIKILAQQAHQTGRQVQALNLTDRLPPQDSLQDLATLANRFTNLIRPLGLLRAGLSCRLMGTGMALPWSLIKCQRLASDNLVEDMQWGIDLALAGHYPLFYPEARVTSALPPQDQAFISQRKRWEHGHLQTIITQVPRLLAKSLQRRDFPLFCLAWDLCIPPLSLLALFWLAAIIVCLAAIPGGASPWPAMILANAGLILALAFAAAWFVHCRRHSTFKALIKAPFYIIRKLPIYFAFILHPQQTWVRTARDKTP